MEAEPTTCRIRFSRRDSTSCNCALSKVETDEETRDVGGKLQGYPRTKYALLGAEPQVPPFCERY